VTTSRQRPIAGAIVAAVAVAACLVSDVTWAQQGNSGRGSRPGSGGSSVGGRNDAGPGGGSTSGRGTYGGSGGYGTHGGGAGSGTSGGAGGYGTNGGYGTYGGGGGYGVYGAPYGGGVWIPGPVPDGVLDVLAAPPLWCGCYGCYPYPIPTSYPAPVLGPPLPYPAPSETGEAPVAGPLPAETSPPPAPVWVQPQSEPWAFWYWCADPAGYYPYVQSCRQPWLPLAPNNVPPDVNSGR
jgi:hypothetical protein